VSASGQPGVPVGTSDGVAEELTVGAVDMVGGELGKADGVVVGYEVDGIADGA